MKNYVSSGADAKVVAATAPVKSGDLVQVGDIVGFAQTDAEIGGLFAVVTTGVFDVEVLSATAVDQGAPVYISAGALTTAASGEKVGVVYRGGSSDGVAARVHVKLKG